MSRRLTIAILLAASGRAAAQPTEPSKEPQPDMTPMADPVTGNQQGEPQAPPTPLPSEPVTPLPAARHDEITGSVAPPDLADQGIGAELGVATGAHITPGGLRVSGHYLYQLSSEDWFDGTASFTFGSGTAACFRDRSDAYICDHGLADGAGVEIAATVRRFIGGQGQFWPFLRAGAGVAIVRFSSDGVTGLAIPFHGGAGVRVGVSPTVAITAQAELVLGFGAFSHGLGLESQVGLTIAAGAEFKL